MDAYRVGSGWAACLVVLAGLALATPASADWVEPVAAPVNAEQTGVDVAPAIADLGGSAYAALEEQTTSGQALVVVQEVDSTWQPVGGPLSTGNLTGPARITAVGSTLYVVWTQAPAGASGPGQVMVDYLDDGAWMPARPQPLNLSQGDDAVSPSIASVGNVPYVAFAEAAPGPVPHRVIVEQYDPGTASWSEVGAPLLYSS